MVSISFKSAWFSINISFEERLRSYIKFIVLIIAFYGDLNYYCFYLFSKFLLFDPNPLFSIKLASDITEFSRK